MSPNNEHESESGADGRPDDAQTDDTKGDLAADNGGIDPSFTVRVPDGDTLKRDVCDHCGFINYVNPKIVVGSVVDVGGKILMCRRAIEPRLGFWTLPAGYMERGETTIEAAMREAYEEAHAEIRIKDLLAVYNIPRISQVQLMYRAELIGGSYGVGEESLEVTPFDWADIPWTELAFPSVYWALTHYKSVMGEAGIIPFGNPEGETGDARPW